MIGKTGIAGYFYVAKAFHKLENKAKEYLDLAKTKNGTSLETEIKNLELAIDGDLNLNKINGLLGKRTLSAAISWKLL